MAFSGSDPVLAKARFFNAARLAPGIYPLAVAFFSYLTQNGLARPQAGNTLQVVEFTYGSATAQVICSATARLLALVLAKPTTVAGFTKISDHATDFDAAAITVMLKQAAVQTDVLFYPKGLLHSTGITLESHTACDGTTTSVAGVDGATGVALISAAGAV
jgi:hypothetical protein